MMAAALRKLELVDRKDHITLTVAKLIIGLAKQGERDPKKLCDRAVKTLRKYPASVGGSPSRISSIDRMPQGASTLSCEARYRQCSQQRTASGRHRVRL
jgi:hypothetical protein